MTTIENDGRRVALTGRAAALARWLMDNHLELERPTKTGIEAHFAGDTLTVRLHQTDEVPIRERKRPAA